MYGFYIILISFNISASYFGGACKRYDPKVLDCVVDKGNKLIKVISKGNIHYNWYHFKNYINFNQISVSDKKRMTY